MIKFLKQIFRIFLRVDKSGFVMTDKLQSALIRLEQLALEKEDSEAFIYLFLVKTWDELDKLGFLYKLMGGIFLAEGNYLKEAKFLVDRQLSQRNYLSRPVSDLLNFFEKNPGLDFFVSNNPPDFLSASSEELKIIKSVIIIPVKLVNRINGFLFFASNRSLKEVSKDETFLLKMISYIVDFSYRLKDTQNSLVIVTQEVYKKNVELHQLDRLKDDFVSVASHELRTPMAAIKSYAWMALHRSDIPLSQKLQRYLYRVLLSTERLINLVNDMLNVSRIEAGRIEIVPQAFNILEFMKDIVDEIRLKADEKRIAIVIMEHKLPEVFADPDKVHEIILNLFGNSLKFTYPGGSITIDFFTAGNMLEISIKDNGSGIDKENLNKLFKKFSRLDNSYISINTSFGGTGLGLYISKNLVERMGGRIWANSEGMDKGATFTFSLPIATREVLKNADLYGIRSKGEVKGLEPVAI